MRRWMTVAALLFSAWTLALAAPSREQSGTATGSGEAFVLGSTPLSFSWLFDYDWYTAHDYAVQYKAEQWVKENKKVDIKLLDAGGVPTQKLATIIASNEYPDVMGVERADGERLAAAGVLQAFDPWLQGSYYLESMGKGLVDMIRSSDGKLYFYPDWMITRDKGNGNSGWMVQSSVYDALGKPALGTFDDLYAYLKTVKTKYPSMIPLSVTQNFTGGYIIYTGFGENLRYNDVSSYFAFAQGNKLVSIFKSPAFKEAMVYTSKLFREKLIDPDSFSLTQDQDLERLPNAAVVASDNICYRGRTTMTATEKKSPGNTWLAIWPIHKAGLDANRIFPNTYNRLGGSVNVITKNAKNPAGIFAYLDWAFSPEGNLIYWFGPPNIYWDQSAGFTPEGYPKVMKPGYFTAPGEELKYTLGDGLIGNTAFVDGMSEYFFGLNPANVNWTKRTQITTTWKTTTDVTAFVDVIPIPGTAEGNVYQSVKDLFKEAYSKMIFAASDADVAAILAQADKDAQTAGMDKLLDYMTRHWQANVAKLAQK